MEKSGHFVGPGLVWGKGRNRAYCNTPAMTLEVCVGGGGLPIFLKQSIAFTIKAFF